MDIFFYTSTAEPNSFPKVLGSAIRYQGDLRDECDILNPVITIAGLNPNNTFNYCYIPDFKRYYFITESSVVRTGLIEFILRVDVLQSWASQILNQYGFVSRNEYNYNSKLTDDIVPIIPSDEYIKIPPDLSSGMDITPNFNQAAGCYIVLTATDGHSPL